MTTATLPLSDLPSRTVPARKSWFGRFIDRIIEARMRQAERHVRDQLRRLPPEFLERANLKESVGEKWTLPFVRGA